MKRLYTTEGRIPRSGASEILERAPDGSSVMEEGGGSMAGTTRRLRALSVAIAPALLLVGFVYHPYVGNPTDPDFLARLAAGVAADVTRWGVAHLLVGLASGLMALAFLAIRSYLRQVGEDRWSGLALPFIVMGSTLYAMLPAMEFAPMAAARTGGDIQAAQASLMPWFAPILLTSAVLFMLGAAGFALAISSAGILSPRLTRLVVVALVLMGTARFVPLNVVQLYVQGIAAIVALWPLAYTMSRYPAARTSGMPRTAPAS